MSPGIAERIAAPPPLLARHASPPLAPDEATGLDLILEGFLLHHGRPRGNPPASGLVLAGDACYAEGLVRVAAAGDLVVIRLLADLIARSASLVADQRRDLLPVLWAATVATIARHSREGVNQLAAAADAMSSGDPSAHVHLAEQSDCYPELAEVLAP